MAFYLQIKHRRQVVVALHNENVTNLEDVKLGVANRNQQKVDGGLWVDGKKKKGTNIPILQTREPRNTVEMWGNKK